MGGILNTQQPSPASSVDSAHSSRLRLSRIRRGGRLRNPERPYASAGTICALRAMSAYIYLMAFGMLMRAKEPSLDLRPEAKVPRGGWKSAELSVNTPGGVGITAVARLWTCFQPGLVGRPLPPAVPARERERHSVMGSPLREKSHNLTAVRSRYASGGPACRQRRLWLLATPSVMVLIRSRAGDRGSWRREAGNS